MTEQSAAATAFDHNSTLVLALELSGKGWQVGAGIARWLRVGRVEVWRRATWRDFWLRSNDGRRRHSGPAERCCRTVLAYEAGRDGFWIARCLLAHGIEVQIMHPASIPVERRGRRAKTDRIDLDMLLRTLLAWLRGEPRVCSMVRIPSETEEDMRRPERERERLVSERIALENRIENLLCLHGIAGFKPRLKKAAERLDDLRSFAGAPLPPDAAGGAEAADDASSRAERAAQGDRGGSRAGGDGGGTGLRGAADPDAGAPGRARAGDGDRADARGVLPFASPTAARLPGLSASPGRRSTAAVRNASRASARTAIRGCAVSCCSWPGAGCASSRTARSVAGSSSAPVAPKDASARSWWWHSPASCWSRCGATSRPAKCRPARASPPPERRPEQPCTNKDRETGRR